MLIDYSTARPPISELKAHGVTAVGRYIGWDGVPGYSTIHKNLTVAEADELLKNDIAIWLAFEYDPSAALSGQQQGTADGALATVQLKQLGAPENMAVYFAIDFDLADYAPNLPDDVANAKAKLGPVARYFEAINALHHTYKVGVYGGYYAVKRVLNAGLAERAWQTVAWSGGQRDDRAELYQVLANTGIAGADADIREHTAKVSDFGQWMPKPKPVITPPPDPKPSPKSVTLDIPQGLNKVTITFS